MIVGLTGGTGTGKTSVARVFYENGFEVIDYDKITREIYIKGSSCLNELAENFGKEILTPDGELNRKKLGSIVFASKEKLEILNNIVYKYILAHTKEKIEEAADKKLLLDAPTLFEAGLDGECDYIVGVIADKEKRLERICQRDGLNKEDAQNRINSQKKDEFYIENCDFLIKNNGSEEMLFYEAQKIIRSICK